MLKNGGGAVSRWEVDSEEAKEDREEHRESAGLNCGVEQRVRGIGRIAKRRGLQVPNEGRGQRRVKRRRPRRCTQARGFQPQGSATKAAWQMALLRPPVGVEDIGRLHRLDPRFLRPLAEEYQLSSSVFHTGLRLLGEI